MTSTWYDMQKKGYDAEKKIKILNTENKKVTQSLRTKIVGNTVLQGGYPACGFYGMPYLEKKGKKKTLRMGYVDLKLDTPHLSNIQIPTAMLAGLSKRALSADQTKKYLKTMNKEYMQDQKQRLVEIQKENKQLLKQQEMEAKTEKKSVDLAIKEEKDKMQKELQLKIQQIQKTEDAKMDKMKKDFTKLVNSVKKMSVKQTSQGPLMKKKTPKKGKGKKVLKVKKAMK